MKKNLTCLLLLILSFMFLFHPDKSFAKQESTNLIGGLSYEVLYPENQGNKNLGYFDLTMQPGQEQIVSLKLYNSLSQELTVQIRLSTAKTNSIGKVEYGPSDLKEEDSLINDFTEIVKGPTKVTIPAKGSKQVDLVISLPKDSFNGLIAGGIQLKPLRDDVTDDQKKKDIVVNEFAFLVGMLLRIGDTNNIKPELKLNQTYIAFKDGKSHLFVNISNIRPVFVEGMSVAIQVRKNNKQKDLFEYQGKDLRMAPNSIIDLPIDLADKGITAGMYTAQINVSTKTGGHWSWTEDFKVNKLEADNLNKQSTENKTDSKGLFWAVFFILCIGLLVFSLAYMAIKRKRLSKNKYS
ncbi:DUF916 and DUF3324 domain-containing protein [Enterococcus sp. 5H]|uniref:DUF916 and DUF3324 domain-containing protein n=1 Tax=Enterococcus sp. 5H TaxID=1229490 RepID=UPI002304763A|nr:DUF916 and DUF3324 domain-containing protein [Enterococcus sp. 5H]MDA9472334.1 cell surface protein precursor [Enterococcus sp. 5H]